MCSSAEVVYEAPRTVSGDIVPNTANGHFSTHQHLRQLWDWVCSLALDPTLQHSITTSHVPHNLQASKFVFVQQEAHHTPLHQPDE